MNPLRIFLYLWAFPNTLIGLLFLLPALISGGSVYIVKGVMEIHGPAIAFLLRHIWPMEGTALAMTLGHVVLAQNAYCLDISRRHERIHVRQYEIWGPLFIPAYIIASIIAFFQGKNPYQDNYFEREAYENEKM